MGTRYSEELNRDVYIFFFVVPGSCEVDSFSFLVVKESEIISVFVRVIDFASLLGVVQAWPCCVVWRGVEREGEFKAKDFVDIKSIVILLSFVLFCSSWWKRRELKGWE